MKKRMLICLAAVLFCCLSSFAQQSQPQVLTFWSVYSIIPGKEDEFLDLVKSVGQPVRDKLMAEGVVQAWGVQQTMIRVPGDGNILVWYVVNDWSGIEKVDNAMRAQIAKTSMPDPSASAGKKGQAATMSPLDKLRSIADLSKTHDYITRDLISNEGAGASAAGLPYTRYSFVKVKAGKGSEYRKAWEKYNKPVFDKLVKDGVLRGYGFDVEEAKTESSFTHFIWADMNDLSSMDKLRNAFIADRAHRTQEEQDAITNLFNSVTDADAARTEMARSLVFRIPAAK